MAEARNYSSESYEGRIREHSRAIDEEAKFWSGGFQHTGSYREIVNMGEPALPTLLVEIGDNDMFGWWRIQAVFEITDSIGTPINIPEEIRDKYDPIRQLIQEWGRQKGYLAEETNNE